MTTKDYKITITVRGLLLTKQFAKIFTNRFKGAESGQIFQILLEERSCQHTAEKLRSENISDPKRVILTLNHKCGIRYRSWIRTANDTNKRLSKNLHFFPERFSYQTSNMYPITLTAYKLRHRTLSQKPTIYPS